MEERISTTDSGNLRAKSGRLHFAGAVKNKPVIHSKD
jgi:hypothetical protein